MKYVLACLTIALLVFSATAANAQTQTYGGVAGSFAWNQFDRMGLSAADTWELDLMDDSWAGHLFGGWNYSEQLAIEADFGYYFRWEAGEDLEALGARSDSELNMWALTVSGIYKIAVGDGAWTPYAIGGIGWGKFETAGTGFTIRDQDGGRDTDQSGWLWRLGGGVAVPISDTMDFVGDVTYVFTTGDIEDLDFVDFRFGVRVNL